MDGEPALIEENRAVTGLRFVNTFVYIHVRRNLRYHYVHLLDNGRIVFFGGSYNSNSGAPRKLGLPAGSPLLKKKRSKAAENETSRGLVLE